MDKFQINSDYLFILLIIFATFEEVWLQDTLPLLMDFGKL